MVLKKQIVRASIHEIVVDLDESRDEVILIVHWVGGHHTPLRVSRRRRTSPQKTHDLATVLNTLRKVLNDAAIAAVLNREYVKTARGETWTGRRVAVFRKELCIPAHSAQTQNER
jgi:hypothetical protein